MASNVGIMNAGYAGIPSLLYYPDIRSKLIERYEDDDYINTMDQMGAWTKKHESIFYTAYDSPLFTIVDTTGLTSVATSGTATITLNALTTTYSGILIPGQLVMLNNGTGGQARVTSVTTSAGRDTVVLASSAAGAPNITLTAGQNVIAFSNAQEEGSLEPARQRWGLDTFNNLTQVFKKKGGITDIQRARMTGGSGSFPIIVNGVRQYESWEAVRLLMAHRAEVGFGCLLGEISDPNFTATSPTLVGEQSVGVQVTRGLVPTIRDFGWTGNMASAGTTTAADLATINAAITAARGPKHYMIVGSNAAITQISSYLKNINTGVTAVKMDIQGRKVDLMVETYIIGGKTFDLMAWNTFDNQQILATANVVSKTCYFIPVGTAAAYGGGKSTTQNYLNMGYEPVVNPGDGNEKQAMWKVGGLAPKYTNAVSVEDTVYQTICGPDIVKPYVFGKSRVLA